MKRLFIAVLTIASLATAARTALGFCGFYVAKVDTRLFNQASQVVLARDGDRTVLTMANDFKGDPQEFARGVSFSAIPGWATPPAKRRRSIAGSSRDATKRRPRPSPLSPVGTSSESAAR